MKPRKAPRWVGWGMRFLRQRMVLASISVVLWQGLGAVSTFALSLIVSRLVGPAGAGLFFLSFTIISIGSTLGRLGFENACLRFASIEFEKRSHSNLQSLYHQSVGIAGLVSAGVAVLLYVFSVEISTHVFSKADLADVLSSMAFAIPAMSVYLVHGAFLKATRRPGTATAVTSVAPFLLTAIIVVTLQATERDLDPSGVGGVFAGSALLIAAIAATSWLVSNRGKEPGAFDATLLVRTGLPLMWVAGMNQLIHWSDQILLGIWTPATSVGIYAVATRISSMVSFFLMALNNVVAPRFAALHSQGDLQRLRSVAQTSTLWMTIATMPAGGALLLFPEFFLGLFGESFRTGSAILRVLVIGQLANVMVGSVGFLLIMTGHEKMVRNAVVLSAVGNLIGNALLIPRYGGLGAAISSAFALAGVNVVLFVGVRRYLGITTVALFDRGRKSG